MAVSRMRRTRSGPSGRAGRSAPSDRIGCFSFQSYKLLNAGEGGMLVTDDAELAARAIIMSGAYEHNWKKHPVAQEAFARWQNRLPLYNTRLGNLSAAVLRPQLSELPRRVTRRAPKPRPRRGVAGRGALVLGPCAPAGRGAGAGLHPVQPCRHERPRRRAASSRRRRRGACRYRCSGAARTTPAPSGTGSSSTRCRSCRKHEQC